MGNHNSFAVCVWCQIAFEDSVGSESGHIDGDDMTFVCQSKCCGLLSVLPETDVNDNLIDVKTIIFELFIEETNSFSILNNSCCEGLSLNCFMINSYILHGLSYNLSDWGDCAILMIAFES